MEWNTIGEIISIVLGMITLFGVMFAAYKWVLMKDITDKEHNKKFEELKNDVNERIDVMNVENQVIVYGLLACLDGLKQLGANGNVTAAHEKIERHLNDRAHRN